jgi:hypothetical protein
MKRVLLMISLVLVGSIPAFSQVTFYYPEVANGVLGGNIWKTTVFLTNTAVGTVANVTMTFTTSGGAPFGLSMTDEGGTPFQGPTITFAIPGGSTKKFLSSGAGAYNGGYAVVTSNVPITGTAIFSSYNGSNGQLIGEAGVPSAQPAANQAIIVDTTGGFTTAVAYANPSAGPASITLSLINSAGALVAATPQTFQELARFPALDARTWNHPALAGQCLVVRNEREAACYELPVK